MIAAFYSFLLIFLSEMGDKTQLLTLVLAARFRKPWTILGGILIATLVNHTLASWVGTSASHLISPRTMALVLGTLFLGFAGWILIPDKEGEVKETGHFGALITTIVSFFLAEMGDKTQFATMALAAKYQSVVMVTIGSTLGMLACNGLAIYFGDSLTRRVPMKWIHRGASAMFLLFAAAAFLSA